MSLSYPHIAAQLIGEPLLLDQRKLNNILGALGHRLLKGADLSLVLEADHIEHRRGADYKVADKVAIIPVIGSLVHRGSSMGYSGMTAYQALDLNLTKAINDPSVESILLDIDSPGGQVAGAFELANRIKSFRQKKKIVAVASDLAASAGYLIACSANEVVGTPTASLGSIGVVMAHVDYSKAMKKAGIVVTHVFAGDYKVDGNSSTPLSDEVKQRFQGDIGKLYDLFTAHVGDAMGIGQQAVIDTQARVYMGQDAVDAGLSHRIGTLSSEFQRLRKPSVSSSGGSRFKTRSRDTHMNDEKKAANSKKNTAQTKVLELTEAELDQSNTRAYEKGTLAERERITGIMAVGSELQLGDAIVNRMITSGQSLDVSKDLMAGIKDDMEANTAINTTHSGAPSTKKEEAVLDVAAIYKKRNGGIS